MSNINKHITTWCQLNEMEKKYPLAVDDITGLLDSHIIFSCGFTEQDYANKEEVLRKLA